MSKRLDFARRVYLGFPVGILLNTHIDAPFHNKLKSMQLHELKLDSTRLYTIHVHGKRYPIKKQRGRYYIQHAHGQLTVTPLMKEVIPHDGSMADYVFNGWFLQYETYESFHELINSS